MDWSQALFDVIDFRSFSNLWYWIMLAVVWSATSHRVLGVPFDMIQRAKRQGGAAMTDLEDMVRINVNRALFISRESGLWLAGLVTFLHTALAVLAFWYDVEFAQAVILMALPLTLVGVLGLAAAARIEAESVTGEALCRLLLRHRLWTQFIGTVSIFVTAVFGMYKNFEAIQGF